MKSQNNDIKKIEDSLHRIIKVNDKSPAYTGKPIQQFDLLEDKAPAQELVSKINMSLKNKLTVTSPFGIRIHPIFGAQKLHNGADFKANYENVYSVLDEHRYRSRLRFQWWW